MEDLTLRRETPADYEAVEGLIRAAFYNRYMPGCSEHYLAHILRGHPDFIPELDLVAEAGGELVGSIMYTKSFLTDEDGAEKGILTFGPIAVRPDRQRRGLGRALLLAVCRRYPGRAAVLGTGETPGTLAFYQACGFREYGREPDYFPTHYDHVIVEEGVELRDRILLRREAEEPYGK